MGLSSKFNRLENSPAIAREDANRCLAARRSTRITADLASGPAARFRGLQRSSRIGHPHANSTFASQDIRGLSRE
jgi:hypothetical protein